MKRTSVVPIVVLLCAPAFAQDEGDVPEKGVARLSLIYRDVKIRQGDTGDETAGTVNAPLLAGDRVFTAGDSREPGIGLVADGENAAPHLLNRHRQGKACGRLDLVRILPSATSEMTRAVAKSTP